MTEAYETQAARQEAELCRERIRELESKVADLRMGRRVLMSLLEQAQNDLETETERLQRENARLQRQVAAYARQLWVQNGRLARLQGEKDGSRGTEAPGR